MDTYITEFIRTWFKKISAFVLQLRQNPSFIMITPTKLETTQKKSEKEKEERGGEQETGVPDLIILSTLETVFERENRKKRQNGALFCDHGL